MDKFRSNTRELGLHWTEQTMIAHPEMNESKFKYTHLCGNSGLTNGRRKIFKSIRCETEKETTLPHTRVSDQQQLKQVIELRLTRRRIHCPKQSQFQIKIRASKLETPINHPITTQLQKEKKNPNKIPSPERERNRDLPDNSNPWRVIQI